MPHVNLFRLTLAALPTVGRPGSTTMDLGGELWTAVDWEQPNRKLTRNVPAGLAELVQHDNGDFHLKVALPGLIRGEIKVEQVYDNLLLAIAAAESFCWVSKEAAGHTWHQVHDLEWMAYLGPGDVVTVGHYNAAMPTYHMRRTLTPVEGETYEIYAPRYDIETFDAAAAIALDMPARIAACRA